MDGGSRSPNSGQCACPFCILENYFKKLRSMALETLFLSLDPSQNGTSTSTSRQSTWYSGGSRILKRGFQYAVKARIACLLGGSGA